MEKIEYIEQLILICALISNYSCIKFCVFTRGLKMINKFKKEVGYDE